MLSGAIPEVMASFKSPSSPCFSPSIIRRANRSRIGRDASSSALLFFDDVTATPSKSSKNLVNGS